MLNKKAFTLIEILVVIVIIGILAGIIIVATTSAINSANDAKRRADLSQAVRSLLIYNASNPEYPIGTCNIGLTCSPEIIAALGDAANAKDPEAGKYYSYSSDGIKFVVAATISDKKVYSYDSSTNEYTSVSFSANSDGPCTVSSGTINLNSQSCSGRATADAINFITTQNIAAGASTITLSSTPTGLAVKDEILIINLQGTSDNYSNVGKYETKIITQINANTLTLYQPITNNYDGTAQKIMIQRIPNYTTVTVSSGATLTANAWDGSKGGVLAFNSSELTSISGTVDMNAKGFGGGSGVTASNNSIFHAYQGTSYTGAGTRALTANFGGGGGGHYDGGGGGGGHSTTGANGIVGHASTTSTGGSSHSDSSLSTLFLGSGGGGGGGTGDMCARGGGAGGAGAGIILISSSSISITSSGIIRSNANSGSIAVNLGCSQWGPGGGGGGAGGAIKIISSSLSNSGSITATGGIGGDTIGSGTNRGGAGGAGSAGIIYTDQ